MGINPNPTKRRYDSQERQGGYNGPGTLWKRGEDCRSRFYKIEKDFTQRLSSPYSSGYANDSSSTIVTRSLDLHSRHPKMESRLVQSGSTTRKVSKSGSTTRTASKSGSTTLMVSQSGSAIRMESQLVQSGSTTRMVLQSASATRMESQLVQSGSTTRLVSQSGSTTRMESQLIQSGSTTRMVSQLNQSSSTTRHQRDSTTKTKSRESRIQKR